MDHTHQPNSGRRAETHDGDVLTPRPEVVAGPTGSSSIRRPAQLPSRFDVPVSALVPLFRARLERIYRCRVAFDLDLNTRDDPSPRRLLQNPSAGPRVRPRP